MTRQEKEEGVEKPAEAWASGTHPKKVEYTT